MKYNVIDGRKALAKLIKAAPEGHQLHSLPVSDILQGKAGWGALVIWPFFEGLAIAWGLSPKGQAVDKRALEATLDHIFQDAFDLRDFEDEDFPEVRIPKGPVRVATPAPARETAPVFGPDGSEVGTVEVSPPAPPAPPVPPSSTSTMRESLLATLGQIEQVEQREAEVAATTSKEIEALRAEVGALASRMGEALATVDQTAKKAAASASPVDAGAIRGLVADQIKALAPSEEEVKKAAKVAKELPEIPASSPYYHAPKWADDVSAFIATDHHGVIGGSSGAGKTFPLKQICSQLGRPCKVISANENLTADTLVSEPQIKGGTSYYTDGPLLHAMRHGYVLIVDEGDEIRRGEALVFNDALESRTLTNPYTGEVVKAAAGFAVWFTSNSLGDDLGIYNREGFDESLRQRLIKIIAKPMTVAQETKILTSIKTTSGRTVSEDDAQLLVKWAHVARPLHFGLKGNEPVLSSLPSTRVLIKAVEIWLGCNLATGAECKPFSDKLSDIREALWYPYASSCSDEERDALKSSDLWVW